MILIYRMNLKKRGLNLTKKEKISRRALQRHIPCANVFPLWAYFDSKVGYAIHW